MIFRKSVSYIQFSTSFICFALSCSLFAERFLYSGNGGIDFGVHLDKHRHLSVCGNDNVLWVYDDTA